MQPILASLRDIPGVFGSFVVTETGQLAARDLPTVYADDLFADIGRRLISISDALEPQVPAHHELVIRFDGYSMVMRKSEGIILTVMAGDTVNVPALKMALTLTLRHLASAPLTADIPPAIIPAPLPPTPLPVAPPPPDPNTRTQRFSRTQALTATQPLQQHPAEQRTTRRIWRGQVVD